MVFYCVRGRGRPFRVDEKSAGITVDRFLQQLSASDQSGGRRGPPMDILLSRQNPYSQELFGELKSPSL